MISQWITQARVDWRAKQIAKAQAADPRLGTWGKDRGPRSEIFAAWCNMCGWHGDEFLGEVWCESAQCPACRSVARDRFVKHCWTSRTSYRRDEHVLETSPRLDDDYREHMRSCVDYLASDFDERLHKADIQLDLQAMDLADQSLDTILTAHVLEHVPDYPQALSEMYRVLRPGGHLFLQVPMLEGKTAPPSSPEFHEDNTPVMWRFGWDLTDACRKAGFTTAVLVTEGFRKRADEPSKAWADQEPLADFNVRSIGASIPPASALTAVVKQREARRLGFEPEFMYVVWDCQKPG